ncbi:hypothetical protein [Neorhizobium sp. T7_12]|uniref:hypothetical protein n=1 Tax=Neorhizobium sp. T7_12 TaxID=2093832 RepID=UPI000CF88473|nr:hypothetical protein [Neorhizobium sp. T7_12]
MASELRQQKRLQVLLHETCRTDDARAAAIHAATQAGMTLSGEGVATLSVRMPNSEFEKLFSSSPEGELTVPEQLKPFVESISEAPEHLSFE